VEKTHFGKSQSETKQKLYEKQGGKCLGCGALFPIRNLTIDHIVPKSRGGLNDEENLQLLCKTCNDEKGTLKMDEYGNRNNMITTYGCTSGH